MANSIFIAKLIGPFLLIVGVATSVNVGLLQSMAREILASTALLFIAGILSLLTGLVLVNTHNFWVPNWQVIITLFGWLALFGGIIRLVFPVFAISVGKSMIDKTLFLRLAGYFQTAIGGYLAWQGYMA